MYEWEMAQWVLYFMLLAMIGCIVAEV